MTLSDLQSLIGSLTNDPNHDRYTLSEINTELDNTQDKWNMTARIIKDTVTFTVVDGTRQYSSALLVGPPLAITRATHKGIELKKRSKSYFDLYTGHDWTVDIGTPTDFYFEAEDPDIPYFYLYPIPQSGDEGDNLVVEFLKRHTSMSSSSDNPFLSSGTQNFLLRPYDWGLAYDVSARLLARDPSPQNSTRSVNYQRIADGVLAEVVQVFKALEKEEPMRIRGGRYWK